MPTKRKPMTAEQRQHLSELGKARWAAQQTPGAAVIAGGSVDAPVVVDESELARARRLVALAEGQERFALQQRQRQAPGRAQEFGTGAYVKDNEFVPGLGDLSGSEKPSSTYHTHYETTVWYDKYGRARNFTVKPENYQDVISAGLSRECPLCHGYHPESRVDPNACPWIALNEPRMKMRCEVCWATGPTDSNPTGAPFYVYDVAYQQNTAKSEQESDAEFVIKSNLVSVSTPEQRLLVLLYEHIRFFHVATAAGMGLIKPGVAA